MALNILTTLMCAMLIALAFLLCSCTGSFFVCSYTGKLDYPCEECKCKIDESMKNKELEGNKP